MCIDHWWRESVCQQCLGRWHTVAQIDSQRSAFTSARTKQLHSTAHRRTARHSTAQHKPPTDHEGQELEDCLRLLLLRVVALGRRNGLLGDVLQRRRRQGVAERAVDKHKGSNAEVGR